jgi:hypothetical protein
MLVREGQNINIWNILVRLAVLKDGRHEIDTQELNMTSILSTRDVSSSGTHGRE